MIEMRKDAGEGTALLWVVLFGSILSLTGIFVGLPWYIFVALLLPMAGVALSFPIAGLLASVFLTMLFERFYTLTPFFIGDVEYKLYPLDVMLLAIFFVASLSFVHTKFWRRFTSSDWVLLVFFAWLTLYFALDMFGAFGGVDVEKAFSVWKSVVFYGLLIFAVPLLFRSVDGLKWLRNTSFFGAIGILVFLGIGIVRGEGLWTEYTPLSTSGVRLLAFPHSLYLSIALLALLLTERKWLKKKWLFWTILIVFSIGIVSSLMRHLWLALGATLFVAFILEKEWRTSAGKYLSGFVLACVILGVSVLFFFAVFPENPMAVAVRNAIGVTGERIVSIGQSDDESLAWRGAVWTSAFNQFSGNPLFGFGFGGQVPVEIGEYHDFVQLSNIHNSWLVMLFQTGLVGLGLFVWFLSGLMWRVYRDGSGRSEEWRLWRRVGLSVAFFFTLAMFSQPYLETNLLSLFFWIDLGILRLLVEEDR